MMNRRVVIAALAAGAGSSASAATGLRGAARDAWLFTLPLMEIARTRHARAGAVGVNRLVHSRRLLDHTARAVTTPNNDTLYATAQLDLSRGPATLTVPPARSRYLSVALMDAYSNNFAVLGTRTTPDGGVFRIVGPGGRSSEGVIVSPTPHVWCLGRTLVASPEDVRAAQATADGIRLEAPQDAPQPPAVPARDAPWPQYFRAAGQLMTLNPPAARDRAFVRRFAPLGLGPGFDPDAFTAAQSREIEEGVAEADVISRAGFTDGRHIDGWSYSKPNLGQFGDDYRYRASVALSGLAALPVEEAVYMQAEGEGRGVFRPGQDYRLHFPADRLPPVDGFWSMSLYEETPEGQYFFAENPLRRYAIGDRTPGLARNADGSLDIWIGRRDPGGARTANWLPAPDKPFALILRCYLPKPALRSGAYRLPRVRPV